MIALEVIVVVLLALLLYAWVGYPLLLAAVAASRSKVESPRSKDEPPRVAVLFAAHNEEGCIQQRLANLLDTPILPYSDLSRHSSEGTTADTSIQIHVGLDGCTDRSGQIANEFAKDHPNVHVHEFEERRGKAAVLKDLVKASAAKCSVFSVQSSGTENEGSTADSDLRPSTFDCRPPADIIVFTDANAEFRPDALEKLVGHFADPQIGGVCGRLILSNAECGGQKTEDRGQRTEDKGCKTPTLRHSHTPIPSSSHSDERTYWEWERRLKARESAVDSCLGANGAIYAIRRELFPTGIPDNTIIDDFVIGMKVREQGRRMVYEPDAVAEEELPEVEREWRRRVRIGAGDFQALSICRKCLHPRYGKFAWMFWSHKVLRWLTGHCVLLLVISAAAQVALADKSDSLLVIRLPSAPILPYPHTPILVLAFAGIFLLCAVVGRLLRHSRSSLARPFRLCDHFLTMQAALFVGFLHFCRGDLKGYWDRTPRGSSSPKGYGGTGGDTEG